jgi:hypothetical protein
MTTIVKATGSENPHQNPSAYALGPINNSKSEQNKQIGKFCTMNMNMFSNCK